jgi:NAD(P)H dehydrogenase (quinone)
MKIAVSGASGHLGSAIVADLVRRGGGHEVIGISRTPDKVAGPAKGRLGDYDKPATLAAAYAGVDRLIIIPTTDLAPGRRAVQNVAAVDAAVAAGVGHIVFVSSAGARAVEEPNVVASYFATEQRLMRTAPKWSVLRMNYYAESFIQEAQMSLAHGALTGLGENKVAFVSRDDLAVAAAGLLTGEGHEGAIYNATGPASLSGAERAAIVAAASGKKLQFTVLPEETLRAGLAGAGLPPEFVGVILSIQAGFLTGGFDIVTGDIEHLSGRKPRSLQELVAAAFAGG